MCEDAARVAFLGPMSQGDLTMSAAILETLLQAPDLPELIEHARRSLATEQKRREKFYADITPEHKWESMKAIWTH
jgi:hypothetical protein